MTWTLNETRRMLADSAEAFLGERSPVMALRALRDRDDPKGYDPALWQGFAEQGYCATLVPEAPDGLGLGVVEAGLIAERIGHTLAATPFLSTAVVSAWLLARGGTPAQQADWLPRIASGQAIVSPAFDEQARHRPEPMQTTAARTGDGWRLQGQKVFVLDGHVADAFIVSARAEQGTVLLLVPADSAGVSATRTAMVDAHNAARLALEGVMLPADALVGGEHGAELLAQALDVGRAVAAAELQGLADEAFDRTVQYLKERKQFDRIIGEFQALQHRAAELWCDLELSRALGRQALQALDDDPAGAALVVAQAKARASLSANRAVQEAVQMHGGIGMTDELEIGLFMKRARVLQALWGDTHDQLDRAARLRGY